MTVYYDICARLVLTAFTTSASKNLKEINVHIFHLHDRFNQCTSKILPNNSIKYQNTYTRQARFYTWDTDLILRDKWCITPKSSGQCNYH